MNYPLIPSKEIDGDSLLISESALRQIKLLTAREKSPSRLRITILGGGCSGFQYDITLDEVSRKDDIVFTYEDVGLVTDKTSFALMKGALIDYAEDMMSSQFVIKNPNARSSCGCGNSFSIL